MNLRDAADTIKGTVTMETVLGLYGYHPRHGKMLCPFHADKTASLKVYTGGNGWHCFGCGRGGSVIDFVMEHEGCGFNAAVKALDGALKLGLLSGGDPLDERYRRAYMGILDALTALLMDQISMAERQAEMNIRLRCRQEDEILDVAPELRTCEQWETLAQVRDEIDRQEDRKRQCDKAREEVRQWQRTKRTQYRPCRRERKAPSASCSSPAARRSSHGSTCSMI